jgi:integrase
MPSRRLFLRSSLRLLSNSKRTLNHRKSDSYTAPAADLRERAYLTPKEVDRLQHVPPASILGTATATRPQLRASELCELTWNMIELNRGRIHVRRAKNGVDSTHPLTGKEIRALRQLRRENVLSADLPMTATTRGRYSTTSGTRISSTQFATPSFRPPASGTSGRTDCTVAPGWP